MLFLANTHLQAGGFAEIARFARKKLVLLTNGPPLACACLLGDITAFGVDLLAVQALDVALTSREILKPKSSALLASCRHRATRNFLASTSPDR